MTPRFKIRRATTGRWIIGDRLRPSFWHSFASWRAAMEWIDR